MAAPVRRLNCARDRFLVLGRAGMDLYADPPGTPIEAATRFICRPWRVGGQHRRGPGAAGVPRRRLLTCVSDDAVGRFCLAELDRYGIDRPMCALSAARRAPRWPWSKPALDDCQSVIYRNGAADFALTAADVEAVDFARLRGAGHHRHGACRRAVAQRHACAPSTRARAAGVPVIFDIDYRPYSWASRRRGRARSARRPPRCATSSSAMTSNSASWRATRARARHGAQPGRAQARDRRLQDGRKGAVTFAARPRVATGIYPITALKPTGAGDGFMGGLHRRAWPVAAPARRRAARLGRRRDRRRPRRLRPRHARPRRTRRLPRRHPATAA